MTDAQDSPRDGLRVARRVALGLVVLATAVYLAQVDLRLPTGRLVVAGLGLAGLAATAVRTNATGRAAWAAVLLIGPLGAVAGQGLTLQPAGDPVVLALLVVLALHADRRRAIVAMLSAAVTNPLMLITAPLVHTTPVTLTDAVAPMPVIVLFTLLISLYQAWLGEAEVSHREALLSRASEALLHAADAADAHAVVAEAVTALCTRPGSGLGLLLARRRGDDVVVTEALHLPGALVGTHLAAATLEGVVPGAALPDLPGLLAVGVLLGRPLAESSDSGAEELMLVFSTGPVASRAVAVLTALQAQVSLVEQRQQARQELLALAHYDPLTTISNRGAFNRLLHDAMAASLGQESTVALLLIDLDDFKQVNDSMGHGAGDRVLVEVAARLSEVTGEAGTAARFGGDEFAVLMTAVVDPQAPRRLAERLRDALLQPITYADCELRVGSSTGVASGAPGRTAGDLLRCADIAMYSAKAGGKNRVVAFSAEVHGGIAENRQLEEHLPHALARGELQVRYQLLADVRSGAVTAVEARPHWNHPRLGPVSAEVFLPDAEAAGLLPQIGAHVLAESCREAAGWPTGTALDLIVRASRAELVGTGFGAAVTGALAGSKLSAALLVLVADVAADDAASATCALDPLRLLGVRVAFTVSDPGPAVDGLPGGPGRSGPAGLLPAGDVLNGEELHAWLAGRRDAATPADQSAPTAFS